MFFTPWLRSFSRRFRFPKRRQKRLSPQQHQKMLRGPIIVSAQAEGLEPRLVLTPPNFVSVTPNGGLFLADGTTLTEMPRELQFQFSPGQTLNANTFGAIQIYEAGHDGGFRPASTVTDFGSSGAAVLRIGTARLGVAENGTVLTVITSPLGLNALPTISSGAGTVTLTLNTTTPTTANGLLNFLQTDALAKTLLTAELVSGAGTTPLTGITSGTPFTLTGAGAASALSDFGAGSAFHMQFQANAAGSAGNLISLQFVRRDMGTASRVPLINVVGNRIEVTLNDNATTGRTRATDLISALQGNAQANALVNASVAFGSINQSLAAMPDGTVLKLSGSDDLLTPGYRNLLSGSTREVIYRFAEAIGDDRYRIQVVGAGANPLTNQGGELVNNGADTLMTFTLNLGAQVESVVPQPVVRNQVVTVLNPAQIADGDILLIDPGTLSNSFATTASDFGSSAAATVTFTAAQAGTGGNGVQLVVTKADLGNTSPANLPQVTVAGRRISVVLNSNSGTETTAQQLIDAVNGNAQSKALVTASLTGTAGTLVGQSAPATTTLTTAGAVDVFAFEFNSTGGVRPENTAGTINYLTTDSANTVATAIANAINARTAVMSGVTAVVAGGVVTISGRAFDPRITISQANASALSLKAGGIAQKKDLVNVYFNQDDLNSTLARDARFYRLTNTNGTLITTDDTVLIPSGIDYDNVSHTATLSFGTQITTGGNATYRLSVGESDETNHTTATAIDLGSLFSDTGAFTRLAFVGDDLSLGAEDVDLYEITNAATGTITVTATPATGFNVAIRIFDASGTQVGALGDGAGSGAAESLTSLALTAGQTYYVGIASSGNSDYNIVTGASGALTATGGTGSYQLSITHSVAAGVTNDTNSSFATATNLGTLNGTGFAIATQIQPQAFAIPQLPGDKLEIGHRDIPHQPNVSADTTNGIPTQAYNFAPTLDAVGQDPQGNTAFNLITEEQKQRAREIFELYGRVMGMQFVETADQGILVATGDTRVAVPSLPLSAGVSFGSEFGQFAIMNSTINYGASEYGGAWFRLAMHEIGHALGLQHSYEVPAIMGPGLTGFDSAPATPNPSGLPLEPVFPGDHDIAHSKFYHRPDSNDIDLFQFVVNEAGTFTAETIAERLGGSNTLNTVLRLYQVNADGTRSLISQNDDYYSNDSLIQLDLAAGTYFIGVSSVGNSDYDPIMNDSGFGGRTEGAYQLTLRLTPPSNASAGQLGGFVTDATAATPIVITSANHGLTTGDRVTISDVAGNTAANGTFQVNVVDSNSFQLLNATTSVAIVGNGAYTPGTGTWIRSTDSRFDGDNDGVAGGSHEFFFKNAPTIFVDKNVVANTTQSMNSSTLATTVRVTDVTILGTTPGYDILIDNERLTVTAVNVGTNTLSVNRAQGGTTAASHAIGSAVRLFAANGSEATPYGLISSAVTAAAAAPGSIIRIVGNGGADNDKLTLTDNRAYLIGISDISLTLEDGARFEVPRNTVVQFDSGAAVKLNRAVIDVGTSAVAIPRDDGALQVLGTPKQDVYFTSHENDLIGGDSDGVTDGASRGDWGGLVFRDDSDLEDAGIFLNYVNHANLAFGGGQVDVNSSLEVFTPIHMVTARPTVAHTTITNSADAALSADPNSFDDVLGRIGPDLYDVTATNNTLNGLFVRIRTQNGQPVDRLSVNARFDDVELTHIITENLEIVGNPGGPTNTAVRLSGRLAVDPGVVVKLSNARIETMRGASNVIAEGTSTLPIIFTSTQDDRFGAGGTFDSTGDGSGNAASAGDWGGLMFNAASRGSIDNVFLAYGGGQIPIEGAFGSFNAIETHQADLRVSNSTFEDNASGQDGSNRNGRGNNSAATIFVRGAQPVLVNNVFRNNAGSIVSVNANAMQSGVNADYGRSRGPIQDFTEFDDNHGPLVRLNRVQNNGINGMEVRGEELTTETIWDDTDIVHVLRNEIVVLQHHTFSGLSLRSGTDESLVVKLLGANAGFRADGLPSDIDDRVGGTIQIIGQPNFPVVLTSLNDDSVGASLDPNGFPQTDTDNDGAATPPAAGQWRSVLLERYSNDRNVRVYDEPENALSSGTDVNSVPNSATPLGTLAPNEKSGDDIRSLGFEVRGFISTDNAADLDVYSFKATGGTEVWLDIDSTSPKLDTVIELIDAAGTVLARSNDDANRTSFAVTAYSITEDTEKGLDTYAVTTRDAGMRVVLQGTVGVEGNYFVRVRSNPAAGNIDDLAGGLTSGEYRLQVRLRQVQELPGSTVRFADIRFAQIGLDIQGLPAHSPLLAESHEPQNANGTEAAPNSALANAQFLGNLLEIDRNTLNVGGEMQSADDVDFYRFLLDYQYIQSIGGVNSGGKTWATMFDIDYAEGMGQADTILSIFDSTGQLILVSRDSDINEDQPAPNQGQDVDDLTRGSVGKLDPFIGTVQLPEANDRTYYVAVSSNRTMPAVLDQTYNPTAVQSDIRLEPVNSVVRIVEDHIGFQGYTTHSAPLPFAFGILTTPAPAPRQTAGLIDMSTALRLDTYVKPWNLSDVSLFTAGGQPHSIINPFTGDSVVDLGNMPTNSFDDITVRPDGRMFGMANNQYWELFGDGQNNANGTFRGNDNIPNNSGASDHGGMAFRGQAGTSGSYELFVANNDRYNADGDTNTGAGGDEGNPGIFRLDTVTGAAFDESSANGFQRIGNLPGGALFGAVTNASNTSDIVITSNGHGLFTGAVVTVAGVTGNTNANVTNNTVTVIDANNFSLDGTTGNGAYVSGGFWTSNSLAFRVTGLAFSTSTSQTLYAVTSTGDLWRTTLTGSLGTGTALGQANRGITGWTRLATDVTGTGAGFEGLALGPQNVEDGAWAGILFATADDGNLYAIDPLDADGDLNFLAHVYDTTGDGIGDFNFDTDADGVADSLSAPVGGSSGQGLAFSPLDFNLWHPTLHRGNDPGHGVNPTFDNSRGTDTLAFTRTINGRDTTEGRGGASFYFGLEQWLSDPSNDYYTYGSGGQFGTRTSQYQRDLTATSNPNGVNSYNLLGGSYGSLQTNSFSLEGYDLFDRPTLYFNYFLDTDGVNAVDAQGNMRDAARVYASRDDGLTWELLATNNSVRNAPTSALPSELPLFNSHSHTQNTASSSGIPGDPRQHVQELFEANEWRQARVDLGPFAGEANLRLRFDFTTSGEMNDPTVDGSVYGNYNGRSRGTNADANLDEGFYIDDILIGFADRGEMVTRNNNNNTVNSNYFSVPAPPASTLIQEQLTGTYQLEIRRGTEYGTMRSDIGAQIGVRQVFEVNDRFTNDWSLALPTASTVLDGHAYTIDNDLTTITFEFDSDAIQTIPGSILVPFTTVMSQLQLTNSLANAINAQAGFNVIAVASGTGNESRIDLTGVVNVTTTATVVTPDLTVAIATSTAENGLGTIGTITRTGSTAAPLTVTLSVFDSDGVTLTADATVTDGVSTGNTITVTIPAGSATLNFTLNPIDNLAIDARRALIVRASATGFNGIRDVIDITDDETLTPTPTFTLRLTSAATTESDRGNIITGYVTLPVAEAAPSTGNDPLESATPLTFRFITSDGSELLPSNTSLNLIDGQYSLSFALESVDEFFNDGTKTVTVYAMADGYITRSSNVTVTAVGHTINYATTGQGNVPLGDKNLHREQGHLQIESNFIRDSSNVGIRVDAAARDTNGSNLPHQGSVINTPIVNNQRLFPGVTIVNNVVARFGNTGILLSGDNAGGGVPEAPAPFSKLINNSIFGGTGPTQTTASGTGISITDGATPTLTNNILSFTNIPISVTNGGSAVVGTTLYQANNLPNVGVGNGNNAITINAGQPLFINPVTNNFYLAANSRAIDSSLNTLGERPTFNVVKEPLGIPDSNIVAPTNDLYGQLRLDDGSVPNEPGLGSNVFKDRGAVERADFEGGIASLIVPEDQGQDDLNGLLTSVSIDAPTFFNQIVVQFTDEGIGIDDATVDLTGAQFVLTQLTSDGILVTSKVLQNNVDFIFAYNANTNQAIFTSVTTFPTEARYNLVIDNSVATGIKDFAANALLANQTDGSLQFSILVTDGANDPPSILLPTLPQTTFEDTPITFSTVNGNSIRISDLDAFLSGGDMHIVLTAIGGTFSLGTTAGLNIVTGDGLNDAMMDIFGTQDEINAALEGLVFTPGQDLINPTGSPPPVVAPIDDTRLVISIDDQGEYWVSPVDGSRDPKSDLDTLQLAVTEVNDEPVFGFNTTTAPVVAGIPTFTVDEDLSAANIAMLGQMLAVNLGPGPVPTANDEYGQTLTFSLTPQPADVTSAANLFASGPTLVVSTGTLGLVAGIGATTLTLNSAASFPASGPFTIQIGSGASIETLTVDSVASNVLTLNAGTPTAFAHSAGELVTHSDLVFTLNLNANGAATFDVVLTDDGLDAGTPAAGDDDNTSQTLPLMITVRSINDEPILTFPVAAPTVNEDAAAQSVLGFAVFDDGDPEPGTVQTWTSATIVGASSNRGWTQVGTTGAIFSAISIDTATGDLSYTLMPDVNGTITVTVRATDSGSSGPAPNDNTADYQFTLTVNEVNDKPAMTITGAYSPFSWQPNAATAQTALQTDSGLGVSDSLNGAVAAGVLALTVNDATGFNTLTAPFQIVVDAELLTVTAVNLGLNQLTLSSATVQAHANGTTVRTPSFATPNFAVGKITTAIDEVAPADPITPQAVFIPDGYHIVSGPDTIFTGSTGNPLAFATGPTIDPVTGNLTYQTTAGAVTSGIAVISVQMQDNGTTALGGVDLADPVDYYIAVGVLVLPTVYNVEADNITLILNPAKTVLEIHDTNNFGTILESYNFEGDVPGGLLIRGTSANNTVTFDYTNGAPIPSNVGVILSGGLGTDSISLVNGSVTSVVDNFSKADQGSMTVTDTDGARVINYIQFENPIADSLVATNRTFSFSDVNDDITLADDLTAGNGVSTISSVVKGTLNKSSLGVTFTSTSLVNSSLTINADSATGTGSDILRVTGFDAVLDTQSFNGIGGADLLIGLATANNTFSISGSNAGTLNTTGTFSSFESLQGGAGADEFKFDSTAGTISGTIDALGGSNTLDYSMFGASDVVVVDLTASLATNVTGGLVLNASSLMSTVKGGSAGDTLTGNATLATSLVGNGGGDILTGGSQSDTISGDAGDDSIVAAAGNDTLTGGDGKDTINAGDGVDTVAGGNNDDSILGGLGNDSLDGDDGNDYLDGGDDNDTINGGNNDDVLVDGMGSDNLSGGSGNDTYVLTPGSADLLTETGSDADVLDFNGASAGIGTNATPFNLDGVGPQTVFGVHTVQLVGTFENFIGSQFDDFVQVDSNSSSIFRNVSGGIGNDKLIGPDFANTWNITGANAGNIFNTTGPTQFMTFSTVENLTGRTQSDSFRFADGTFGISGVIDAGTGIDTLQYNYTAPIGGAVTVVLSATGTGTATRTGGIISFESVVGGDGDDSLTGDTGNDTLVGNNGNDVITGSDGNDLLLGGQGNDVLSDGLGSDSLNGSDGDDRYVIRPRATDSDSVNDSSGSDVLDFGNSTSAIGSSLTPFNLDNDEVDTDGAGTADGSSSTAQTLFTGATLRLFGGVYEGFVGSSLNDFVRATVVIGSPRTINGNGATDTLLAGDSAKNWHVTAANGGDIGTPASFSFSNVENLVGGTSTDSFEFSAGGSVAGTINGGTGTDVISFSPAVNPVVTAVTVNLANSAAFYTAFPATPLINGGANGGFSGIESFIGSNGGAGVFDTLIGPNAVRQWNINNLNEGTIDSIPPTPTALVNFSSFENLTGGTFADTFTLASTGSVSGAVNGGTGSGVTDTLSYAGYSSQVLINLTTNTATALGSQINFESFIGGSAINDSFTGPSLPNNWNITEAAKGTVINSSNTLLFESFETLGGGNSNDTFNFASGASISQINGGPGNDTLNLSSLGSVRTVTLTETTSDGFTGNDAVFTPAGGLPGFTGINSIAATSLTPDSLTSTINAPTTWNLGGGTNNVVVNGQTLTFNLVSPFLFESFSSSSTSGNTFNINGPVTANLIGGSGNDVFNFSGSGSLTGSIAGNGGNDTLSFSGISAGQTITLLDADANGYSGLNSLISDGFSGINTLAGGNGADTLIGRDVAATWAVGAIRSYTSVDSTPANNTLIFSNIENLNGGGGVDTYNISGTQNVNLDGGAGNDSFNFANGAVVTGSVAGGTQDVGGQDIISYAGNTIAATVNLNNLNGIEKVIGGNGSDTLIGLVSGSNYIVNALNSGTVDGILFLDFDNLTGSGGNDSFNLTGSGNLLGAIDGGLGTDTLSFEGITGRRIVTLTGMGGLDGFNGTEVSVANGFKNINTLTGSGAANDELISQVVLGNAVDVATWAINNTRTYSANGRTLTFSLFETLMGGNGNDEFTITGTQSGNLHGGFGIGQDTFRFAKDATLTGNIDGGAGNDTLSFDAYTTVVTVTLDATQHQPDGYGGTASPILGGSGFLNIDTVFGGSASDVLNGENEVAAWEVDGTNRYRTPGSTIADDHYLSFDKFENLNGGNASDRFVITGDQTVNLSGNDGNDSFILTAVSNLTGTINGGNDDDTFDLSNKSTSQSINLANLNSIESLIGSSAVDTLVAPDTPTAFVIAGPNSGTAGGIGFSGFENLQGGAAGDTFQFFTGGSISGSINGNAGSDVLDFSSMSTSQAIILTALGSSDGFNGTAGATVGSFTNIDSFTGSNTGTSDSVQGLNVTAEWSSSGATVNYTTTRTTNLSNFESLLGGAGIDTFTIGASSTVKKVDGGSNDDTINASSATIGMSLLGGAGNDTILGGTGNDNIDGGLGVNELRQTVDGNQTLTDSSATGLGGDTLANIQRALLTGGASTNTIDASGFSFATTLNGLGGNDTIIGGTGNDSISGGDGTDSVTGGSGSDTVDGGNGDGDTVSGGLGNDSLTGGAGINDRLIEIDISGTLTLTPGAMTGSLGSDTFSGFEAVSLFAGSGDDVINASAFNGNVYLDGGDGNDTLTGGSGNDTVVGGNNSDSLSGGAGTDSLDGGAGNDSLSGGLDNDTINGGADTDRLVETGNVNLTLTNSSLVGLGTDTLTFIEGAILTGGIDNNTINASAFTSGSVTLNGGAGNDSLIGGSQGDSLDGSDGLDTLLGNGGNDTLRGGIDNDSLDGGDGNDDVNGQLGNDTVRGGSGSDTVVGELGNDLLDGGTGLATDVDVLTETANVDMTLTATQLVGQGTDTLQNFESVVLTGGADGNRLNATGYVGKVTLFGMGGNDTLTGGSGNDSLDGGEGNDQLTGALGNDVFNGGNGTDLLVESGVANFTLSNVSLIGLGNNVLIAIESAKLTGAPAANSTINASAFTAGPVTLIGGSGNDVLLGGSGNDSIDGGSGNDSLVGGLGNDIITGGSAGKDTIRGGAGNDTLNGGAGGTTIGTAPSSALANSDDIIYGDAGNDNILGQGGNDFLFGGSKTDAADNGNDTIDGGDGHDVIDGGTGADSLLGGLGNDAIRGGAGNDTLNGNDGNDSILGGTGADNILGGSGNDVLRGEAGNDTIAGQGNIDSLDGGAGTNMLTTGEAFGDFSAIFSDTKFNALISAIP